MKEILLVLVGVVIGYLIGRKAARKVETVRLPNAGQVEAKREHLEKILESFGTADEITNDKVEKMLGVSDASAERYLNQLEHEGRLRQVGKTGKYVIYRKI